MGVAAEKEVKLTSFSGGNATARYVGDMFGVGEMTIRMRAMRHRAALVYSDSVMAAMERETVPIVPIGG